MSLPNHLVVFAKEPRLGRVKSRLARDIGTVPAWAFYRQTLNAVLRRLGSGGHWQSWLAVAPDAAVAVHRHWPRGWSVIGQGPGDLGHRMGRIMRGLPPGPAVIIGTDIPHISRRHISQAFEALGRHDAVFGPAADGGYWLVGLKRRPCIPELFDHVRWSGPHALADTMANLDAKQTVFMLETLEDVDDAVSHARWKKGR
ncbi:MAG: TIGR04282 family arsenosugar biosynthesis glycosyltransferase [Rhodospirillales bacterium]|nr:TIGR04282 family arsenosugar biosynthesis glycosyltransferase [Rhodospirillales bacterium]